MVSLLLTLNIFHAGWVQSTESGSGSAQEQALLATRWRLAILRASRKSPGWNEGNELLEELITGLQSTPDVPTTTFCSSYYFN